MDFKKMYNGMKGVGKSVAGMDKAGTDLIEKRMGICNNCPFKTVSKSSKLEKCKKCGCFLKYKTRLKSEKCPIGKW